VVSAFSLCNGVVESRCFGNIRTWINTASANFNFSAVPAWSKKWMGSLGMAEAPAAPAVTIAVFAVLPVAGLSSAGSA